jgi:hypothetical protein
MALDLLNGWLCIHKINLLTGACRKSQHTIQHLQHLAGFAVLAFVMCGMCSRVLKLTFVPEYGVQLLRLLLAGSTGQHMAGRNGLASYVLASKELG